MLATRGGTKYERSRSLFGYNDDSNAPDTEEEAEAVGAAGTAAFGREVWCEVRWANNHARTTEFRMCLAMRWYKTHSHCFILYVLSCLLLATGARGIVWELRLNLRIVYSKRSIKEPMLQIGHKITVPLWQLAGHVFLDRVLSQRQLRLYAEARVSARGDGRQVLRGGQLSLLSTPSPSLWLPPRATVVRRVPRILL